MEIFDHLQRYILTIVGLIAIVFQTLTVSPAPSSKTSPQGQVISSSPSGTIKFENQATNSAIVDQKVFTPTSEKQSVGAIPWGTTEKIEDHIYRTYVGQDERMATSQEILEALNVYRKNHGQGELQSDEKLCELATKRVEDQAKEGFLDKHKGLEEYMKDPEHWKELDLKAIGENSSQGYVLTGTHLIEWVFDADEEHRSNQQNPSWNLSCARTKSDFVVILFGKR